VVEKSLADGIVAASLLAARQQQTTAHNREQARDYTKIFQIG
jgi:hypothetical protein